METLTSTKQVCCLSLDLLPSLGFPQAQEKQGASAPAAGTANGADTTWAFHTFVTSTHQDGPSGKPSSCLPKTKLRENRAKSSHLPEEPEMQQGRAECVAGGSSSLSPAQPSLGARGQHGAGALTPGHRVQGAAGPCTAPGSQSAFFSNLSVSQLCTYQQVFFTTMCEIQGTVKCKIHPLPSDPNTLVCSVMSPTHKRQ